MPNVSEDIRQTIVTNKTPSPSELYFLDDSFSINKVEKSLENYPLRNFTI